MEDLYVACSGNFTIERVLADRFKLHSNDVSIYTSVVVCIARRPRRHPRRCQA